GTCLRLFLPVTFRDLTIVGYSMVGERRFLSAFAFVWKNRQRTLRKRRIIQARRRVPEAEIRSWFRNTPEARALETPAPASPSHP
ncbi:MAG TPA: hypothetical protein VJN48_16795, partial [Terriglobales bacterium]|nr:hypothetical protein [Terriglobales bacterium]